MFTGIIEATARVQSSAPGILTIERPASFDDLRRGSSVSVQGVCLTVRDLNSTSMTFDVVPETLSRTALGKLRAGDRVNLERAMSASARLDGHIVQGHVEGIGIVAGSSPAPHSLGEATAVATAGGEGGLLVARSAAQEEAMLIVRIPKELRQNVIEKGSIAIDGVSLTVASLEGDQCTVALIPMTIAETTLGSLKPGDPVHIETDVLVRSRHSHA